MNKPKVLLSSFDRVPSAKGASQHIRANIQILRRQYEIGLLSLGASPLADVKHVCFEQPIANWLRRAEAFQSFCARTYENYPDYTVVHGRSPWELMPAVGRRKIVFEVNALPSIELLERHPNVATSSTFLTKVRHAEDIVLHSSERILTPSRVTAKYVKSRLMEDIPVDVVPNAPSFAPVNSIFPSLRQEPFRVVYIGSLSNWQGLSPALRAMSRSSLAWSLDIFTGAGKKQLRELQKTIEHLNLSAKVQVRSPVAHRQLAETLSKYDLGLAPLLPCARNLVQGCMPIKILDYLAAGLPVLAPDMPVVREIVGEDYPLYTRYSLASLLEVFEAWSSGDIDADLWKKQGLASLNERWTKEHQSQALLDAYQTIFPSV